MASNPKNPPGRPMTLVNRRDLGVQRLIASYLNDAKQMAKTFGVTIKEIFWTQGRYDIVAITKAPDEIAATALNLSLSALGNIRTESLRAFSAEEMTETRIDGATVASPTRLRRQANAPRAPSNA
jgi:uncharacterized protein with GYD domain